MCCEPQSSQVGSCLDFCGPKSSQVKLSQLKPHSRGGVRNRTLGETTPLLVGFGRRVVVRVCVVGLQGWMVVSEGRLCDPCARVSRVSHVCPVCIPAPPGVFLAVSYYYPPVSFYYPRC